MLQFNKAHSAAEDYGHEAAPAANSPAELLENLLGILRRQYVVILFVSVLTVALALIYVVEATPRFTAVATMFIDRGKVQPFAQQQMLIDNPIDSGAMDSQIEILKSDAIALSVINSLHLTDDPEFGGSIDKSTGMPFGSLFGPFHFNDKSLPSDLSRDALASFESRDRKSVV